MKNITEDTKLAIYIAERLESEEDDPADTWYHTFLMLVDEASEPVRIVQQLHYNEHYHGDNQYTVLPNVRLGVSSHKKFKDLRVHPLIGGRAAETFEIWNYAISYALYLKVLGVEFDAENYKHGEESLNCRAAVKATLRAIGMETDESFYAEPAGLKCTQVSVGTAFDAANSPKPYLAEVLAKNEALRESLDANWIPRRRYVEPIKHPFLDMDGEPLDLGL